MNEAAFFFFTDKKCGIISTGKLTVKMTTMAAFDLSLSNSYPLLSMAFILGLGVLVFFKNPKAFINRLFFMVTIVFGIWQFGTFMMFISPNDEAITFWDRFIYLGVVFMPALQYHFSLLVTRSNRIRNIMLNIAYVFSVLFLFFSRSDYFVFGVYHYRWGAHTIAQIGHHFFLAFFFFYIFALLYNFYRHFRDFDSQSEKYRMVYFAVSFAILNLIGGLGYLPAYKIGVYPISLLAPLVFSILIAYAIIVHRLMDIKLVMRRYSVYLVSLSSVLILVTAIKYFIEWYYADYSNWADLFILLVAISFYPAVKNYFYRLANKYFFSSLYDSGEVIASLSDKLRSTLEAEKIYEYIFDTLSNAFHVKAFGVLTHNEKNNLYTIRYNQGFKVGAQTNFPGDEALHKMFVEQNKIIVTEEVRRLDLFEKNPTIELLLKLKVEILAPLNVKDKTIGLIALGAKESGDMYNDEDLQVLEVVGAQAAISLENALLYKETKNFSVKMEKEVEKATHDLKKANVQLKKLDAAKSEFISIASHQLRTPLTVIKGYISMMLEGNFGTLTKPETESLEKVFASNERLIQLVENLLNISRIESGRLQFDFQTIDLNKMVENVAEELSGNAKKKNLILEYKPPAKPLPKIKIDDEKIRQVVMNLIDNAIKYTKQGSVTIKLEQSANKVKFCVADSGIGIRPEDMGNLFKKFSRGSGTSLIHTEGTGLGLYVARMMIEMHHGKIWAESDGEGKGSRFCFELPIK